MFSWSPTGSYSTTILNVSLTPEWQAVFWSVNIVLGLDVVNSVIKIVLGSYNRLTLSVGIILDVVSFGIIFQISQFTKYVDISDTELADFDWEKIEPIININVNIILAVVFIISAWSVVSSVRKLRYFKEDL